MIVQLLVLVQLNLAAEIGSGGSASSFWVPKAVTWPAVAVKKRTSVTAADWNDVNVSVETMTASRVGAAGFNPVPSMSAIV